MAKKAKLVDFRRFFMDVARIVCIPLPFIFRIKKVTPEGAPYREKIRGGALLAANHTRFADPFVVATAFWYRRAYFFVAEVVMKNPVIATLLRGVGAIKIERGSVDLDAIKKSVSVMKEGRLLIVFPQGGITQTEDVQSIKSGSALMALQAQTPIIPLYICPKKHWYERQLVVVGNTINPADICSKKVPALGDIHKITDALMAEMNRCAAINREAKEVK